MNHKYIKNNLNKEKKNEFNNVLTSIENEKLLSKIKDYGLNKVKNRFLPIPENVERGLEHEPDINEFEPIKKMNKCSMSVTYLVKNKNTKALYILRAFNKKQFIDNNPNNPSVKNEIIDLYKIYHPNIVKTFGYFENDTFFTFIKEYCSMGNLNDLFLNLKEKKIKFNFKRLCFNN